MTSKRVLFVDDDASVLSGLRRALRPLRDEWDMTFVDSGRKALAHLADHPTEVVVSDMRMPQMDGITLLDEIRQRHPESVRIMLSGFGDEDMILRAGRVAHQFLAKPCDADVLKAAVARSCALRSVLDDAAMRRTVAGMETVPALPRLYDEISEVLSSPDASLRRVSDLIAQDAGMMAKLLQLVNSAFFGLRHQVTDQAHAATLAGLDTIKALVLSVGVFSSFEGHKELHIILDAVYEHSTMVAVLARRIATHIGLDQAIVDEAATAGMLHDVGVVILAANFPEKFREVVRLSSEEVLSLQEAEMQIFGTSHAQIGAYLLGLWGLPDDLVEAVAYHHQPSTCANNTCGLLTVTHVANALVHDRVSDEARNGDTGLDDSYLARVAPNCDLTALQALVASVGPASGPD